ncbi:hypothetical protein ACWGE0_42085 [Lentzea sp. NPDC054927]
MRLTLGALVIAVTLAACGTTPVPEPEPEPSRRPETTAPRSALEQDIQTRFTRFVEALNSKNDDAMFLCTLDAYAFAESMVKHAVSSTEAQLAQLPVVHRLQVYEMRTSNSPQGVFDEAGALRLLLVASRDLLKPAELSEVKVEEPRASALASLPGYAQVRIPFGHGVNGTSWVIDLEALFKALSDAVELNGRTADQFVDEKLAERYGARAAELRKPMK